MTPLLLALCAATASPAGGPQDPSVAAQGPAVSPDFTQGSQFTNARLWRLDVGSFTVEQGWSGSFGTPRAPLSLSDQTDQLFVTSVGIGLLSHLEFDVSAAADLAPDASGNYVLAPAGLTGVAAGFRVALGRYWGQIWGNPTIDLSLWGRATEPTRVDARLEASGSLGTPRLLGVVNLVFARNLFHDDRSGIDYRAEADLGLNYALVTDVLRVGAEATAGLNSHGQVDAEDDTIVFPTAQLGPSLLLTDRRQRFRLLAAVLLGLASWDPPWAAQVVAGTTF